MVWILNFSRFGRGIKAGKESQFISFHFGTFLPFCSGFPFWALKKPNAFKSILSYLWAQPCPNFQNWNETFLGLACALVQARKIQSRNYSRMHAVWATMPATTVLGCHLLTDIPFSVGAHAYDVFRDRGDWLLPLKLSRAIFVRTSSESTAQRLRKLCVENEKLRLIHRSLEPCTIRDSFELVNPSFLTLLSVGRLVEKKGYFLLLQILSEMKRKQIPFEMNIIGGGPLKNELEREILRLRLENNLFLHDHLNESAIDKFYQTSDAFLFTGVVCANGDRDGIPNVIPEAMSHGLLVMGSNQAGASEAFTDRESGYSLDPQQQKLWVDILHQFYKHPAEFTAMRKSARSRAQTLFSSEQNCQKLKNLFN